jgi:hypothetical protein
MNEGARAVNLRDGVMTTRPVDKRALGLVMREAERRGVLEPPNKLRDRVESLPFTPEEIDLGLELLVDPDGRTLGGTLDVAQLDGRHVGQLVLDRLIEMSESGWRLTTKGQTLSRLLDAYADPNYRWRSLIVRDVGDDVDGLVGGGS